MKRITILSLAITLFTSLSIVYFALGDGETTKGKIQLRGGKTDIGENSMSKVDITSTIASFNKRTAVSNAAYNTAKLQSVKSNINSKKTNISENRAQASVSNATTYNMRTGNGNSVVANNVSAIGIQNPVLFADNSNKNEVLTRAGDDGFDQFEHPGNIASPLFLLMFLLPFIGYKFLIRK